MTELSSAARRLVNSIIFALEIMWIGALPLLFMLFYVFMIGYVMVLGAAWGLGVFVWAIPIGFLSPVVYAWYKVLERRYRAYLAMMMATQPVTWNTDAAIEGWLSLTKASKKERKKIVL